jgi:hypothetical protein
VTVEGLHIPRKLPLSCRLAAIHSIPCTVDVLFALTFYLT